MAETALPRGTLISFRNDRLGARLLSLVNAMRMSADYDVPFAVYWPQAVDVTAVFNDATELFQADFVDRYWVDRASWIAVKPDILRIGDVIRAGVGHLKSETAGGKNVSVDQAFGINVLKGEDPETVKAAFIDMVDKVPFADALKGPIAQVRDALEGATAYHIRRGDLTDGLSAMNKPWPHKMVPHEFYELHMERSLDKGAILFSDDAWTLDHYKARFPALKTIHDLIDIDGLTEAQRDFIELYAMSRAAKIIAPERSAFSSTAVDLGRAIKLSVTDDMTDEMSAEAHERLIARLRDRPESFPGGDGEIGQSLAHVGPWLVEQERWAEAAKLFADRVADGLNIAFIYPDTMRYQHRADDVAGVLDTARHMHDRFVFHVRYYVDAELQYGYALIRAGKKQDGLRRIVNGFWHGPTSAAPRILVPALIDCGVLTAQNFLPVSKVQTHLHRRRGPLKHLVSAYPEIVKLPGVGVPTSLGTMDSVVWDWAPLLRSVSLAAAQRQDAFTQAREQLDRLQLPPEQEAERASLHAVFHAFEGDTEQATAQLSQLANADPAHVMTWQRLSHAHFLARDFAKASEAAEQAWARGKDMPAISAWSGMVALRNRAIDLAVKRLTRADALNIGLPSIPAMLADASHRAGKDRKAIEAIGRAVALAPMSVDFAILQSRLLDKAGRLAEAIEVLDTMVGRFRAPGKLFSLLIEMQTRQGDTTAAAETLKIAQQRFPDHPIVKRLTEQDAA